MKPTTIPRITDIATDADAHIAALTDLHAVCTASVATLTTRMRDADDRDAFFRLTAERNDWISLRHRIEQGVNR